MEPSRASFSHPLQPYSIQLEFMQHLYRCIEDKKVGIFESPTGTGKSLSLICGSLTWLRDHERRSLSLTANAPEDADWLIQAELAAHRRELLLGREELERNLARIREDDARRKQKLLDSRASKKARTAQGRLSATSVNEDEFMLDDYDSESEESTTTTKNPSTGYSSSTQALLDKLDKPNQQETEPQAEERLKIIFCSRTHSQLSQFASELRRVRPQSSIPPDLEDVWNGPEFEDKVKHLPLGSRQNLCINPRVARLPSTAAMNEQCLELQKPGIAKDKRCPYLPSKGDKQKTEKFRDRVIADIRDIEEVAAIGREMELCPYYASRSAIGLSEVLSLPYPLLLQKSAREALGVSIKDNIVIVDEAHNLMDAIADTLSVSLRLSQLVEATRQVTAYAVRFKSRLKGKNRVYLTQVLRLLNSLTDCLQYRAANAKTSAIVITAAQLMSGKGVDQIKPHKLLQYLHESKLCHKVEGYADAQNADNTSDHSKNVLMHFQNFLLVLMNPDEEGRFFLSQQETDIVVKYNLLDPREHFRQVVQDARAVILAGGTMSPMSDYSNYLFSYLEEDRLQTFSFGHVIPSSHLFAQAVARGPSDVEFDFTFEKRGSERMILELGTLIMRTCGIIPDGVVAFFPSYEYLGQVLSIWQRLPMSNPIMAALRKVKTVFQESKQNTVDELLREYADAIDSGKGGLMLSVVGGKLSEGINFSDKLGRAVIAVGLPFPNAHGAEWKAKMQHIEDLRYRKCVAQGISKDETCRLEAKQASREFYENACMRSVNQSIGRAIRHRNDYAAILTVDRRFATERIQRKLPGWIQGSMSRSTDSWRKIEAGLESFIREREAVNDA